MIIIISAEYKMAMIDKETLLLIRPFLIHITMPKDQVMAHAIQHKSLRPNSENGMQIGNAKIAIPSAAIRARKL